jgi:hypothetical protein
MISYGRDVFAYDLGTDTSDRVALSLLEPAWVGETGLAAEAILGFVGPATDLDRLGPESITENRDSFACYLESFGRRLTAIQHFTWTPTRRARVTCTCWTPVPPTRAAEFRLRTSSAP